MPLDFSIHAGNIKTQLTLRPFEEQIIKDFSLSKFIVYTDKNGLFLIMVGYLREAAK